MDNSAFRVNFPEFADTTVYTDAQVTFWSTIAESLLPECRWGTLLKLAVMLFTAHQLAIATRNQQTAAVGGTPGQVTGPLSAKAVDKVSASYDTGAVALDDAGFWNMTTYGIQLYQMYRMFGAGGIQL